MSEKTAHGVISYDGDKVRRDDFLFRVSLKCLIQNEKGEVLVVKETGRTWWDLPGGGMDHGESIKNAIAREMQEEVNMSGDFSYKALIVEEPAILKPKNVWQLRLIFDVKPQNMNFSAGDEADEVAFMDPNSFKQSELKIETKIYEYARLTH